MARNPGFPTRRVIHSREILILNSPEHLQLLAVCYRHHQNVCTTCVTVTYRRLVWTATTTTTVYCVFPSPLLALCGAAQLPSCCILLFVCNVLYFCCCNRTMLWPLLFISLAFSYWTASLHVSNNQWQQPTPPLSLSFTLSLLLSVYFINPVE